MEHINTDATDKLNQLQIAKQVLKLSDYGAFIRGEMSKIEARAVLHNAGWSDRNIANLEGPIADGLKQIMEGRK